MFGGKYAPNMPQICPLGVAITGRRARFFFSMRLPHRSPVAHRYPGAVWLARAEFWGVDLTPWGPRCVLDLQSTDGLHVFTRSEKTSANILYCYVLIKNCHTLKYLSTVGSCPASVSREAEATKPAQHHNHQQARKSCFGYCAL